MQSETLCQVIWQDAGLPSKIARTARSSPSGYLEGFSRGVAATVFLGDVSSTRVFQALLWISCLWDRLHVAGVLLRRVASGRRFRGK